MATSPSKIISQPVSTHLAASSDNGLRVLPQGEFRRAIYLEQKRTERSRRKFALMLATCSAPTSSKRQMLLAQVLTALTGATRETDISGWYERGVTLGVIFTEIGDSEAEALLVHTSISSRVMSLLRATLPLADLEWLQVSFLLFPEDWHKVGDDGLMRTAFDEKSSRDSSLESSLFLKRAMDIVSSTLAILILSPVMMAIAIAIKLTSKGPVLFKQQRVGRYGKRFTFLKFRSMRSSNNSAVHQEYMKRFIAGNAGGGKESDQAPVFKIKNDTRVTPLGRFLRRSSLDELPQFFNVLLGDMSLVGPRPPIPYEVECYEVWHRRRLLAVNPGITGLWQVSGRSKVKFDDMVRLDLKYARTWTIWLDLKILLKTPQAVLGGEGAF